MRRSGARMACAEASAQSTAWPGCIGSTQEREPSGWLPTGNPGEHPLSLSHDSFTYVGATRHLRGDQNEFLGIGERAAQPPASRERA
jgi:hypothetical protein